MNANLNADFAQSANQARPYSTYCAICDRSDENGVNGNGANGNGVNGNGAIASNVTVLPIRPSEEVATVEPATELAADNASNGSVDRLVQLLVEELAEATTSPASQIRAVATRMAMEVDRICQKSDRIQRSGEVEAWQIKLARHRLHKCLRYYQLGSRQGRAELQNTLSAIVYRYIAPAKANFGFQARYNMIEDFLQGFYIESLRAFRREHVMEEQYSPRTRLALAEYMAFTEQYAKRPIHLSGRRKHQIVILRAQEFAQGHPPETALDLELAVESARGEEAEQQRRSADMQQVRQQMVAESVDLAEDVLRDDVIEALVAYLEGQGQSDCVNYLTLKLQDLTAQEIDDLLGLSPRQRDYLQQRFKYHVEKFARTQNWQLVHQWLGADLEQNLGMTLPQWEAFYGALSDEQRQLVALKRQKLGDRDIARALNCTVKQTQKRWSQLLEMAWQERNRKEEA